MMHLIKAIVFTYLLCVGLYMLLCAVLTPVKVLWTVLYEGTERK